MVQQRKEKKLLGHSNSLGKKPFLFTPLFPRSQQINNHILQLYLKLWTVYLIQKYRSILFTGIFSACIAYQFYLFCQPRRTFKLIIQTNRQYKEKAYCFALMISFPTYS